MQKEFTYPIDVRTITSKGMTIHLQADEAECAALADRFDVPRVISLSSDLTVRRAGLIVVEGTFKAVVEQICVVSLEKFENQIQSDFKLFFDPDMKKTHNQIIDIDVGDEEVEPIVNGRIDVGAALAEQFGLNLDLFPKKTKQPFCYADPLSEAEEKQKHPFSELKNLLKG